MAVISRVNPNFPIPGVDQSSKGFRDNFSTIKSEIENLQAKTITLVGEANSQPIMLDSGDKPVTIVTTGNVYRQGFDRSNLSTTGVIRVVHNINHQIVMVQISNDVNQVIIPDLVTLVDANQLDVDLSSYGTITGTWNVFVRG